MADQNSIATVASAGAALVSLIALFVSIKSYSLVKGMKALDLRLELKKAYNDLDVLLSDVEGFLEYAHQSHVRVLSATGRNQSGESKIFEEDFERDRTRLRGLLRSQPRREGNSERLTPSELEEQLVAVHAFHAQVTTLHEKYQKLVESDDERRREIRAYHERPS